MPDVFQLFHGFICLNKSTPITVHAFNANRTRVAVSPNNNQVHILSLRNGSWTTDAVLTEHDKLVTGIDWAAKSNTIVSCSQDRNAYVWSERNGTWTPTLVNLRINRAATHVKWSPNETKFAVASGARVICICYFEQDNNWWVAKHLKKPLRSTVLCVDWHPDGILLAAGSSDKRARVFSAFIKGLDQKIPNAVWGEKLEFGTVCGEFTSESGGWVHSIAFSPSGNDIAFVSHDSTLSVANPRGVATVKTTGLPLVSLFYLSENSIVAAGHDCTPMLFQPGQYGWTCVARIDEGQKQKEVVGGNAAMNKFRQMDSRAQTSNESSELPTIHQNTITCAKSFDARAGRFSTSGVDGKLVVWDLMSSGMANLRI